MKVVAKPIEVVAWFDKTGKIHPVRFRIENEDGTYKTIVIEKILDTSLEKLCGNHARIFTCQSNINDVMKIYEIKFILETSQWMLFKI
jgi:hypothetical protein